MMAALRRLVGIIDRVPEEAEAERRAREQTEQVARLLRDISAQTRRLEKRGFHGGRPEPGHT
jgi:hypothetical protein